MSPASLPLLAQEVTHYRLQWGRIHSKPELILAAAVCAGLVAFVWAMYRRDARELGRGWGWLLAAMRSAVFAALLAVYCQPQWRAEREEVQNPRVVVLVDTSQSMKLVDSEVSPLSRQGQVAAALEKSGFLERLRDAHDVVVMRFDDSLRQIALLPKREGPGVESPALGSRLSTLDWDKALEPAGRETRLGEALQQAIAQQHGVPVAGVVLLSDGGQNAGRTPESVLETAAEAGIPLYPVGVGSTKPPANVAVEDLEVPERLSANDSYTVTGRLRAQGLAGQPIGLQLVVRNLDNGTEQTLPAKTEILPKDGEPLEVKFRLTPQKDEKGRRRIVLRVLPPKGDRNPDDNQQAADTEIEDRKVRVLLFAGAASREYQFVRGLLHRDKASTVCDVLLQTGAKGISQEAGKILDAFPATAQALDEYDCVVAFDPQWQSLKPGQVDLLEKWVGEQGGGLIVVAGPVYAGQAVGGWVQDPAMAKIRGLYPVEFHGRSTILESGSFARREPRRLELTDEYRDAPFLWLAEDAAKDRRAWHHFFTGRDEDPDRSPTAALAEKLKPPFGIHGCLPIRGPKPGAKVYARFADPQAGEDGLAPVYMAGQFYGCGRVFYLGSGEMWRLRRASEGYFERFYTGLVRHVAQVRLLQQSKRGSLAVDKQQCLVGSTVEVRAALKDAQSQPLRAAKVPLQVIQPDGTIQTVTLRPDPGRAGAYTGQVTVLQKGQYRLQVSGPEVGEERTFRRVQVSLPDLEQQTLQRDEALLRRLAEGLRDLQGRKLCEGKYYATLGDAFGPGATDPLASHLHGEPRIIPIEDAPDQQWERVWLGWMMACICGLLCGEWLIRRLWKLA